MFHQLPSSMNIKKYWGANWGLVLQKLTLAGVIAASKEYEVLPTGTGSAAGSARANDCAYRVSAVRRNDRSADFATVARQQRIQITPQHSQPP